jgi:hypothetical protein
MEPWFSEATRIPSLEAEICFLIQDDFYYGPDRLADFADRQKFLEHLGPPDIQRFLPSMVRTSEAFGNELKLAAYYEQIVCLTCKHRLTFNAVRQYFWLRFWLWNTEQQIHVSFPWYDSFSEIDRFLDNLAKVEDGLVDHDLDQGWEMETYAHEGMLYIRQRDPDAHETHLAICVPRQELAAQVAELRGRTSKIIANLASTLGTDVWTSYVRSEPSFRTQCSWWRM